MTDKDRHSTWANSKVSNPSSQSWYTLLVEVNQAKLAWSFRQRFILDQILKWKFVFQEIYARCHSIYVLKKKNSFNSNLTIKEDVLKQSQLMFHLLWCWDFCLIYEILSILCVAVCATSCGENRHYRQCRSTSHLVAARSVSCLLRASLGHREWCKAELHRLYAQKYCILRVCSSLCSQKRSQGRWQNCAPIKIISFWTTTSGVEMLTQEGVAGYLKDHL